MTLDARRVPEIDDLVALSRDLGAVSPGYQNGSTLRRSSDFRFPCGPALLLLLENLLRGLPVIDAGRISRLCRVDLGVGGVVGADRAVAVTDAGRIIYFRLLDLGVGGVGGVLLPRLLIDAVRVPPLQLLELAQRRVLLLLVLLFFVLFFVCESAVCRGRRLRVRLRARSVRGVGLGTRHRGPGDGQRKYGDERDDHLRGHWAAPSVGFMKSFDHHDPMNPTDSPTLV